MIEKWIAAERRLTKAMRAWHVVARTEKADLHSTGRVLGEAKVEATEAFNQVLERRPLAEDALRDLGFLA